MASPIAILYNSSSVNSGNVMTWNLDINFFPKFWILFASNPLFGFWVAIKAKSGCFLIIVKGNPGTSILIISESKTPSMHSKTAWFPKFISSKRKGCPYLNALKKWPSWEDIPAKEFLSLTIFPKRSDGTVYDEILNFIRGFLVLATRQANSVEKVLEVPDGPSNKTGTPFEI